MPAKSPCIECRVLPKWGARHRCRVCYFRHQPIGERIEEARRRLAMVPVDLRRARVSAKEWPAGERWCATCQSFVPLEDCRGSQCVPCASMKSHSSMIEKTYGIDAKEYERLLKLQGGKCAICRAKPKSKRLAVDHSHALGNVRGLLCSRCNHDLLGAGWDSMTMILAAWHYLNTPPTSGSWILPEAGLVAPAATAPAKEELDLDPPDWGRKSAAPTAAPAATGQPGDLVLVGGSWDADGRYRIYQRRDDGRAPF